MWDQRKKETHLPKKNLDGCRFITNKPTFKNSDEKAIESAEFTQIHSSTFIISLWFNGVVKR